MQAILASNRSTARWLWVLFVLAASIAPVRADFRQSEQWFRSLDDEQRLTIQTNLTLAGFYDAFIDGAFGPSTYRAIVAFQGWRGELQTGTLDSASQRALSRAADSVVAELDLQVLQDERALIEIAVPRALLPESMSTSSGTAYTRSDGAMRLDTIRKPQSELAFGEYFESFARDTLRRKVTYKTFREGYFVVSGAMDGGYFYTLMLDDGDDSTGFILNWSPPYQKQGSIVSLFLASFASPLQPGEISAPSVVAEPGPAPAAVPAQALPASSEGETTEIGNFLLFRDLPGVIGLRGEIGPSTPLDFRRAVRAADNPRVLILASEGGYVSSALLLAYAVREMGLATYVLPETGCYSACSFVYFAGAQRRADGALGVHQVWGDDTDASTAQEVVSDILEAFVAFGVRQEITSAMLRTKPEDMYIFSEAEIARWGINSGDPMSLVDTEGNAKVTPKPDAPPVEGPATGKQPRATPETSAAAYVQLGSQRSEDDARSASLAILTRYGSILQRGDLEIRRVDLGEQGVFYRILMPAGSRSEATAICDRVRAAGGDCILL
jgi:peptidoglycan hydrolase-like protein with peptidoglycan-binding domain